MFCAGCGTQIQSGLNYCSRCGRRVAEDESSGRSRQPLAVAGYIACIGFVSFIFVLLILARSGVAPNVFAPLAFVYFAALFGICFTILRLGVPGNDRTQINEPDRHADPAYLHPVTTAQLDEFREPASVTDHTTRTLDEVPLRKL